MRHWSQRRRSYERDIHLILLVLIDLTHYSSAHRPGLSAVDNQNPTVYCSIISMIQSMPLEKPQVHCTVAQDMCHGGISVEELTCCPHG